MTVKTFAGVLLKAGRAHRRKQRAKKALESGKKLSTSTLRTYITDAGLKKKSPLKNLGKATQKILHKKTQNLSVKSISKYQHRAGQTKLKEQTRLQKPTTRSGIEIKTQKGTHYGIKGIEHKMHRKGAGAVIKRMPYVGSRETWGEEMHRMYGGVHMSQTRAGTQKSVQILAKNYKKRFKKKKAEGGPVKLLRGALLTKGIRAGFKIFKKESPQLFSKMKRSRLQLKTDTKKIKTPELIPLGISKIKPDDLRKLTIAQGVKIKVKNQAKIALRHNRKAMPLLWSKAKSLKQVYKLGKYDKPNTKRKIDKFFKEHTKLEKYIDKIKSKSATKHSHGGEVVIHNNVDRSLL